jgi:hypothetical protein
MFSQEATGYDLFMKKTYQLQELFFFLFSINYLLFCFAVEWYAKEKNFVANIKVP